MSFKSLSLLRHSVRAYKKEINVEDVKLKYILDCIRLAPSAVNFQPWKFLILKSEEAKEKVYPCYDRSWLREAPVIIVCCADHAQSWKRRNDGKDHADIDVAIATEHLCLAAAEQGLGTCWVCNFDAAGVSKAFDLTDNLEPMALVPLGYPADDDAERKPRKPLEEITEEL